MSASLQLAGSSSDPMIHSTPITPQSVGMKGKVLVVDDCAEVRCAMRMMLRHLGLEIITAENGREAYEQVVTAASRQLPFDLVLMDMHMPVVDGWEAAALLRSIGFKGRLVALSACGDQHTRRRCVEVGCDQFVTKPISYEGLKSVMAANLPVACPVLKIAVG